MKLFKNGEFVRLFVSAAGAGLLAFAVCLFFDVRAAMVCIALTAAVCLTICIDARRRYRRIAALSNDIDRMLSGERRADVTAYSEGELSILKNELEKLMALIDHQETVLKNDKRLLADSIADISHQIRTPLTSINLLLAALDSPDADEAKRAELLSELHRQIARIDRLVMSLLKLARLDADAVTMEQKTIPIEALMRDALEPVNIQMELREQRVDMDISGCVACDPSWTAEAISNVIKNCSEHMGAGTLTIRAHENPLYSEIVIRDSGPGIAPEDLPHIFERFYKGRNSSGTGIGIGLALMRAIVVKQNGSVKAENAKEGGAKFTVRFYKSSV